MQYRATKSYVPSIAERGKVRIVGEAFQPMPCAHTLRDSGVDELWRALSKWTEARIRRRLESN
jgi:hypothetical protein